MEGMGGMVKIGNVGLMGIVDRGDLKLVVVISN